MTKSLSENAREILERWITGASDLLDTANGEERQRLIPLRKAFWVAREALERPRDFTASMFKEVEETILTKASESKSRETVLMALKATRESL
jgi:hypothetical protein